MDKNLTRLIRSASFLAFASMQATSWSDEAVTPQQRPRVVVVQPVILCDDDGSHPAAHSLPKTLVDQVYTKAGLEFIYLEPARWNNSKARRGEINLDQIVREGRELGTVCRDRRVVTLLFVSAIDGNPGPMGRGRQNGNVCFVTLGPGGDKSDQDMQAFVVAHEVGHCLNLKHVVDDPLVPDDVPNLQGEGVYRNRLAIDGLHDTQRDTVLKSPLVLDRLRFHSVDEGRELIVDESWEPYITGATDDFLRFSMGFKSNSPIPQQPQARRQLAEQAFAEKVLAFTDAEQAMLTKLIRRLDRMIGTKWPCVSRIPWHFLKVDSSFCSGFPHTRGMSILLSPRRLQMIAGNEKAGLTLLLHEKLHVIQRLNGPRFESLYQDYGFHRVKLAAGEVERLNVMQNPDAFDLDWAVQFGDEPSTLVTVFQNAPDGRLRFRNEYRQLNRQPKGVFKIGDVIERDDKLRQWQSGFLLKMGLEHPNETSAYLSSKLLDLDFLTPGNPALPEAHTRRLDQTRKALEQIMRIDGE